MKKEGCQARRGEQTITLKLGDCIDVMQKLPANSVAAIVCDPPYG